ncbi:hypothetical protein BGX38DRAFT_1170053, partial [Terfezia claveryi]
MPTTIHDGSLRRQLYPIPPPAAAKPLRSTIHPSWCPPTPICIASTTFSIPLFPTS